MRFALMTFGVAIGLSVAGIARGAVAELRASRPEVRKAVVAVIDAQLTAFRAGDPGRAYGYSSASLRAQTSLRAFTAIVQANYPEIWTNQRAEYGLVRDDGTRARVLVEVAGARDAATFEYVLIRERTGWRVGSIMRHDPRAKANAWAAPPADITPRRRGADGATA